MLFSDSKIGLSDSTSSSDIAIIIGAVSATIVLVLTLILLIICFRHRRVLESTRDVGNIQNAAYEGDTQPEKELPQIPGTGNEYEEPAQYAQLDSSKRVPTDDNYQSLNVEGYEQLQIDPNENIPQYASLKTNNNSANNDGIPGESVYEELP